MKAVLLLIPAFLLSCDAFGQTSALTDEFSNPGTLASWKKAHEDEGWPDQIQKLEVANGNLIFEPKKSGWFNDDYAPLIYKEVTGDFDVQMRFRATGISGTIPQTKWSLGGLMVRQKKMRKGEARNENWLFINAGAAEIPGKYVIESKYTLNSESNLKLRPGKEGWITVRVVRIGHAFVSMYKYDGDKTWTVQDRYYIQQWSPVCQIGLNGYTGSAGGPNDLRIEVDFIRFATPSISFAGPDGFKTWFRNVTENDLTDYSVTNEELLKRLGGE